MRCEGCIVRYLQYSIGVTEANGISVSNLKKYSFTFLKIKKNIYNFKKSFFSCQIINPDNNQTYIIHYFSLFSYNVLDKKVNVILLRISANQSHFCHLVHKTFKI